MFLKNPSRESFTVYYKRTSAQQWEGECSKKPYQRPPSIQSPSKPPWYVMPCTPNSTAVTIKSGQWKSFSILQNANYSYSSFLKTCNSPPHELLTESCAKSLREGTRLLKEGIENRQQRVGEKSCDHSLGGCSGSCILRLWENSGFVVCKNKSFIRSP